MSIFAVVLAGGSGTRFWPASRRDHPKQLLALGPSSDSSLIAATVRRLTGLCPPERILISTGARLVEASRRALPGLPPEAFLGEPVARNTAPCIGWATQCVARRDPDATIMVLPSDHHIGDEGAFRVALERAVASAETGSITTIGIEPTRPETGYGYVEAGDAVADGVLRVERFVEKPDRNRAEQFMRSGRHFWNSGMFFFQARAMLSAIERHLPELHRGLVALERAAAEGADAERAETLRLFEAAPAVSIDYGIMEKEASLHVVPASFGWSDLGSWHSAWELSQRDHHDNALDPNCLALESTGNLVRDLRTDGAHRVIATVGVEGLCVVATDDALLVIPRERAQDVRLVVDALRERGRDDLL
jgi:mannose-1-phosphate guanylyltransferase